MQNAPEKIIQNLDKIPFARKKEIAVNHEVIELAKYYIEEKIVTPKSFNDTLHIALATVYKIGILSSWNFKHIVNLDKIRLYNAVNLKHGYPMIEIRSPRDLITQI